MNGGKGEKGWLKFTCFILASVCRHKHKHKHKQRAQKRTKKSTHTHTHTKEATATSTQSNQPHCDTSTHTLLFGLEKLKEVARKVGD